MLSKRIVSLLLAIALIAMFGSVSWALESQTSGITAVTPSDGAVINSSDTELSFIVTGASAIQTTGHSITVNGDEVSTKLQYQGHYATDSAGNSTYVVDSYNQATVTGEVTGLKDGVVNVEAQATDQDGNKISKSWQFTVLILPVVTNQVPDGKTDVSTATPKISVDVAYNGSIFNVAGSSLKIDDATTVKPVVSGTNPNYHLSFSAPALKDGSHKVTLTIPNTADAAQSITTSWSFNVEAPPVITKTSPDYTVTSGTPTLAAYAADNSGLAKATFTIDGEQTVSGQIDTIYGRVSAKVPATLQDKQHNVALSVYDGAGNVATATWTFNVDTQVGLTYPDMPVTNNATCWSCHPKNFTFNAGDVNLAGSHTSPSQCQRCHGDFGHLPKFLNCIDCHYGSFFIPPSHANGVSPTVYQNLPYRQHPIRDIHLSGTTGCSQCHSRILTMEHNRLDKTGNQITCDTCHTGSFLARQISTAGKLRVNAATAGWSYGYHYVTWYTPNGAAISKLYLDMNSSLNLADIYVLCDTPYGKQWARVNQGTYNYGSGKKNLWIDLPVPAYGVRLRIMAYGNDTGYIDVPIAMTAIDKSNPEYVKIQKAIAANDTRCTACHDGADHEQIHTDTLDDKCRTCHKGTLTQEHLNNATTQGKGYSCDTCHASSNKNVEQAIKQQIVSCGSCHQNAHNLPLANQLPGDIALYSGFTWTAPVDGALFTGDTSTPDGYEAGQVVISNRQNINVSDVWSFYKTELADKQWVLQSAEPASGADYFAAEFAKNGRTVMIRCFRSALGDGNGGDSSGYRLEIWYK